VIGYLRGQLLETGLETAILYCGGVGYEIQASIMTLAQLEPSRSKEVSLWIYTHVREDALALFGFLTKSEKDLFLQLLKVNGIGPKMAMNILSGASFEQILEMIESEDVKALSKLPKVGKKTAEQMILALKGKLVLSPAAGASVSASGISAKPTAQKELTSALVNLGFRAQDVEKVVASLPKDIELESGLKQALSALTNI
jgi:Holliday junction DNA helicase RuvA